jgi:hypothetical protein
MGTGNNLPQPPNSGRLNTANEVNPGAVQQPQSPINGTDDLLPNEIGSTVQQPLITPEDTFNVDDLALPEDEEDTPPPAPTGELPVAPEEEPDYDAILARFKNDPRELAKSWQHAQRKITEQAEQLKATQPPPEIQPTPTPQATQPVYDPSASYLANPDSFTLDEQGFPIDPSTGEPFLPKDQFGVPFTPSSRWEAMMDELNVQYEGNPVRAMAEYQRRLEGEKLWRSQQFGQVVQQVDVKQAEVANTFEPQMAQTLAAYFPPEIAQEMVKDFRARAEQGMKAYRESGQAGYDAYQEDALAQAMNLAYFHAFNANQLVTLAEQARARIRGAASPINGNQQTARMVGQPQVLPPPTGNNGASSRQLTAGVKKLVDNGVMKADEAQRYLSDNFEFDGD